MIWGRVLRAGGIAPHGQILPDGAERPAAEILRVSTLIAQEAREYIFDNTLVFYSIEALQRFLEFGTLNICRNHPSMGIRIFLSRDDLPQDWLQDRVDHVSEAMIDADLLPMGQRPPPSMYQHSHHFKKIQLRRAWENKIQYVLRTLRPSKLQIDLRQALCPEACCNMIAMAVEAVKDAFQNHPSQTFELLVCDKKPQDPKSPEFRIALNMLIGLKPTGTRRMPTTVEEIVNEMPYLTEAVEDSLKSNGRHRH